jgi:DNA primase
LSEINDIEFHTPLYKAVLRRYKDFIEEGTVPDADLMIREATPDMVALMVNLTLDKWQVSENWEKKHEISIPKEDERLPVAAYENILRLKKTFVESLENQLVQQIAEAERAQEQDMLQALMAAYMELMQQRVNLSQPLGNVVSRRQGK